MVRRYSRAASLFFDVPLALLPSKRDELVAFWQTKLAGAAIDWEEHQEPFATSLLAAAGQDGAPRQVAVIPILGTLSQRMNLVSAMSGGTSTEQLTQAFREALNDPQVSAIVFDIDSPGGSTNGITELANIIMDARGSKPIAAVANPMAASAAYWLGAAADHFFAEPSGLVGSIGVYAVHEDISQQTAANGVSVTFVSAGKNKLRGNPYQPLSEADVAHIQTLVDDSYAMFLRDVARGRRVSLSSVRNGFGQGDVVTATNALSMGMIDGIKTLEQVVAIAPTLRPRRPSGGGTSAAAAGLTLMVVAEALPPHDTGTAPEDESFERPTLADFTDQRWEDLSASERMRIARHAVWTDNMPPETFGDLHGFHHRPSKTSVGPAVWRGVSSGRMEQASWSDDEGVRRHRGRHYHQFGRTPPWEQDNNAESEGSKLLGVLRLRELEAKAALVAPGR